MRVIYRKIRHARYLYIKRKVEEVWGARYLSKNTVHRLFVCSAVQVLNIDTITYLCHLVHCDLFS